MTDPLDGTFAALDPVLRDMFVSALEHSYLDNHEMALRHAKGFNAILGLYQHHQRVLPPPFYSRPMDDVIRETKQAILERYGAAASEWDGDGSEAAWMVE